MKAAGHYPLSLYTAIILSAGALLFLPTMENQAALATYLMHSPYLLLILLLVCSWVIILRNAKSTREQLLSANHQLEMRTKELEELNHTLETKIHQRTKSLSILQTQLLQSEKFSAIGQLSAGIAHEINNPIGFINSNLQTLQQYVIHYKCLLGILNKLEKSLKDKDHERTIEIVASWEKIRRETNFAFIGGDIDNLLKESIEGAGKIGRIVADLRTLATPGRGVTGAVNVETLMESMVNIVHNEIKYKAELKKEYGEIPSIICNPQEIGQVFVNLLMNAAQAIEGKGTITVKTYSSEEHVCVDIKDTGCGIAPENFTKIFDPLFTTKSPGAGVGLGLSLSYAIVRKHGGKISFDSKLGEGSVFTVTLPLAALMADPAQVWRDYERD